MHEEKILNDVRKFGVALEDCIIMLSQAQESADIDDNIDPNIPSELIRVWTEVTDLHLETENALESCREMIQVLRPYMDLYFQKNEGFITGDHISLLYTNKRSSQ